MIAPKTPQQNGVIERRNMTLLEMVRSMMSYSTLPISFWGYALNTIIHLLNLVPSKSVPKTPMELWSGRKPSMKVKVKVWLLGQFDMKELGEANFILGIRLWRDRKNKMLGLSQAGYIDKVLERFSIQNSKK